MREESLLDLDHLRPALMQTLRRLSWRHQLRNPVMFVVYIGSIVCTAIFALRLFTASHETVRFIGITAFWLWFTVFFANLAEALAEGRGKAQAESLRQSRKEIHAKRLRQAEDRAHYDSVPAPELATGDLVLAEAGDYIPADGQVVLGIASIDESAITGESAPVIRESGGDRDAVTGGTRVLSDWVVIRITADPGQCYIDKMIGLVESARRHKTPNEVALSILLAAITIVFLLVSATLVPYSFFGVAEMRIGHPVWPVVVVSLLVCLIPTTIGGLLSAIGISGMQRLLRANVIATSGRAVEAAGDVNVLLLDKTGTITIGNRQAAMFHPATGVRDDELAMAASLSSLADETPEGRSIVSYAAGRLFASMPERDSLEATFLPFSAETRMSGIVMGSRHIVKGAADVILAHIRQRGGEMPRDVTLRVEEIARTGGTPLVVADDGRVMGVLHLKDVVKPDIKHRLAELRAMGIRSVMITGDNPLTAAAIATEAGVDDFVPEATPESKLRYIRRMQEGGELVAMVGDGTNDAPALAQADVAMAMNNGTQAAKEAANMVDLDGNPTKLIEVVEIGKQLLMTRGALTTFSLANDIAKYFAIIPAAFASTYPALRTLDVMRLSTPHSAILSAVIFNALIIVFLIPLALKGVRYRPIGAAALLRRHLLIFGGGGIIVPFLGIKAINIALTHLGIV